MFPEENTTGKTSSVKQKGEFAPSQSCMCYLQWVILSATVLRACKFRGTSSRPHLVHHCWKATTLHTQLRSHLLQCKPFPLSNSLLLVCSIYFPRVMGWIVPTLKNSYIEVLTLSIVFGDRVLTGITTYLSPFRLLCQSTVDWVAFNKRLLFLLFWSLEVWDQDASIIGSGEDPPQGGRLPSYRILTRQKES